MTLPAPNRPPLELKRVLIVDDEAVVLTALSKTLQLEGYEVFAVEDPLEAIHLVQTTPFSVILSDQQMPALSGLEFLAQVKEVQPNATRILITAVLSLNTVIEAINRGEVYRFIVKPWLREELLITIRNAALRYELICRNASLHAQTTAMNQQLATQLAQLDVQNRQLLELNETLHKNLDRSVQLCLRTMEAFYPLLGQKARRVLAICQAMADTLNLPEDQRRVLEIGSRLCDIGLPGAPSGSRSELRSSPAAAPSGRSRWSRGPASTPPRRGSPPRPLPPRRPGSSPTRNAPSLSSTRLWGRNWLLSWPTSRPSARPFAPTTSATMARATLTD